jgi:hypothetical protein
MAVMRQLAAGNGAGIGFPGNAIEAHGPAIPVAAAVKGSQPRAWTSAPPHGDAVRQSADARIRMEGTAWIEDIVRPDPFAT